VVLPIPAFWRWWADGGAQRLTEAVETGEYGQLPAILGRLVSGIDEGLEWELGPGRNSRHALCVTAAGVAALRPLAERWLRAAPPRTQIWEFHAARQPDPGVSTRILQFDGLDLPLAGLRFDVAADRRPDALDVTAWHPAFPALTDRQRHQVTFLMLDWLLGEDDVERWLGAVSAVADEPAITVAAEDLTTKIKDLASRRADQTWAVLEGRSGSGARVMVSVLRPLRWIDQPLLDQHNELRITYGDARPDGLPTPEASTRLRALQDDLLASAGSRAALLVHQTSEGTRRLHVYSDSEDQNVTDLLQRWAKEHGVAIGQHPDPAWTALRPFR
jgi:hypothetical protein